MTFEPFEPTSKYSKTWANGNMQFSKAGKLCFETETKTIELTEFDEFFIHMLNDYLPTITMNPDGDGLDRLQEFRQLYIETLLEAEREYVKGGYSPP